MIGGRMVRSIALATLLCFSNCLSFAEDLLPADIGVVQMGAGRLFVNREGLTLYTYKTDQEQPGTSVCIEECATAWPPATAAEGAKPVGDWSVIRRPDGSGQWAYQGRPAYRHAKDTHAGAIIGEKASRLWDVLFEPAATPPGINIRGTRQGQGLVDVDGRVLYTHVADTCDDACLRDWRPVEAAWLASALNADWTILRRKDGLAQWAYKNQPLFTGTGEGGMQGWQPVLLQPAPPLPAWVTLQETDFGPVLADDSYMTIYYLPTDLEQVLRETCDAKCVEENWQPVTAPAGTQPIGNWSTLQLADGTLQWTYLGLGLFRYKDDKMPADYGGDKFATGVAIRGGWQAIHIDTLTQKLF